MKSKLRVCASCEWIFNEYSACPKCGFAYLSAHYTYGKKCYTYAKTQKPWKDKKMHYYEEALNTQIKESCKMNKGII